MVKTHYPRYIAPVVTAALTDAPVVAVVGARQAGKSTLVQEDIRLPRDAVYVTLDDPLPLSAARADPDGFVSGYDVPLVVDEVQRAGELFRAIKRRVDRDRRPGRYLLTGSADVFHLPRLSESLAGRVEIVTLWPLAQAEIEDSRTRFVDALFAEQWMGTPPYEPAREVFRRLLRGGFPEVVKRRPERRGPWLESYTATIIQREVSDIAAIERLGELAGLMRLVAARSGTVLNVAEMARGSGLTHTTLTRYLALLELTYLAVRVPAWSGSISRRLLKHPKLLMVDSALAAHLAGVDLERLLTDGRIAGPLLETFVAMEIQKQLGWNATRATLHHYRTAAGGEVDLVLERADGALAAIEVKAGERLEPRDVNGLRSFRETVGRRFHRGVVLYTGREVVPFDAAIRAVPITALWT